MNSSPQPDAFADLARRLANEQDSDAVLLRVVDAAVELVEGAEHAGVTMLTSGSVTTPAASSDLVRDVDHHQYAIGEGPCLTAALEHQQVVLANDLGTDPRWPRFTAAATGLGVRSMLSFQLHTGVDDTGDRTSHTLGSLNIYAPTPHAFTDNSVHTGTLLAAHAAAAVTAAQRTEHLRAALQSRAAIDQAKGILMERHKITAHQAFDLLITASQHTNVKLRQVAEHLNSTGELIS